MTMRSRALALSLGVGLMVLAACGGGGSRSSGSGGGSDTGQLSLKWDMAKPCLRAGEKQELTTHAVKGANVAYAIIYADEVVRGNPPHGDADSRGTYKASWVIPADVPTGSVRVRILAVSGRKRGSVVAPFKVIGEGTPC